jgi:hypothetical protein
LRAGWYHGNGCTQGGVTLTIRRDSRKARQSALLNRHRGRSCYHGVRRVFRALGAPGHQGFELHLLQRAQRRQSLRHHLSDLGHHTHRLQHLRGNSLYQCQVACPPGTPNQYKGAAKVSFNRPNNATLQRPLYALFGAEFQLVQFLEANGYDVSYISGVDTPIAPARWQSSAVHFLGTGRVLVGRPARQRRGRARCQATACAAEPGLLQRQRGVLENPL